ncbi:uncharacterized protein LOC131004335 [Salvia miltiorrhiza]|uniref:uncharacterized protein LOC131004335 n=1 Tax=Salvia miltiorrhiza TaxID=226208 RepID=UPI0025AD0D09|nr:uncharacterized protein LOC131004335 [Salvia miltiorrhiza]
MADETKMSDLERQNVKIIRQNEEYKQEIDELYVWIQDMMREMRDMRESENALKSQKSKRMREKAESEKALESQQSKMKAEVSRLNHALRDSEFHLFDLGAKLKGVEDKLDAMVKERDLLLAKIEKLEEDKSLQAKIGKLEEEVLLAKIGKLEEESEGKEKEIRMLKTNIEESEVGMESHKLLDKLRAVADNFINANGDAWLMVQPEDH